MLLIKIILSILITVFLLGAVSEKDNTWRTRYFFAVLVVVGMLLIACMKTS